MTDQEYEEALRFADELDKEGTIACGGFDESKLSTVQRAEYICLQEIERKAWTKLIVNRFARIRKEAREEAAERAMNHIDNNHNEIGEWTRADFDALRASIVVESSYALKEATE